MDNADLDLLYECTFEAELLAQLDLDDGSAALAHLAAGRPVYFHDRDTPTDLVTKLFPDGTRQLVRFDTQGEHLVCEQDVKRR
ncbi:hypothetical protein J2797_003071 [Paraburkholderia terricola]|uniref:hypothetical protein n=1 Tax=Paraburkholderia terricola TaxID=169427 RepID=UPI002859072C|nr:hypothetical protein [Paraburkholderia terricola]MDR6493175.1 hypothetical protein [Paraburkholderia terricola]